MGTFISLWLQQAGRNEGLSGPEAIAKAGMIFAIIQTSSLLWAPVAGKLIDRFHRLFCLMAALLARKYCIGAFLLDRDDPTRVIGRLRDPLIKPSENEREGYVPNVVYFCGSLVHGRQLVVPYAMSDYATTSATLSLDELLAAME